MHTIFLNGADYQTGYELHDALQRLLNLPDYYGHNADALHDCLKGWRDTIHLVVLGEGNNEVNATMRKIAAVIRDLDGKVTGL